MPHIHFGVKVHAHRFCNTFCQTIVFSLSFSLDLGYVMQLWCSDPVVQDDLYPVMALLNEVSDNRRVSLIPHCRIPEKLSGFTSNVVLLPHGL
mmetsp:Transcript_5126/g.10458  ORF Transcript_5126/g.10458 Transcript_5126/m.10458 type:complete len:93 (-) Transcript_5126:89-367(-)